jgi:membrane-associated phospholipid phosphatase
MSQYPQPRRKQFASLAMNSDTVCYSCANTVGACWCGFSACSFRCGDLPLWSANCTRTTYSFPSGHAMGSATLGMALSILCWPTRWRGPVTVLSLVFVVLVGISRVYLGVHYPSDILAGWSAAIAWVFGMYVLVDRKAPPPAPSDAVPIRR